MTQPASIESLAPGEGAVDTKTTALEWTSWALRKQLPSELVHKPVLRWTDDVVELTGIPEPTLKKGRANGDHPRLYAIGRALFTTLPDLLEWFEAHELAPGERVRPATIPKGSKLTRRKSAAAA